MSSQSQAPSSPSQAPSESESTMSSGDVFLEHLLDIIASQCNSTRTTLRQTFASPTDLKALSLLGSSDRASLMKDFSLNSLQKLRLGVVLRYLDNGGKYQVGMTFETIQDFIERTSSSSQASTAAAAVPVAAAVPAAAVVHAPAAAPAAVLATSSSSSPALPVLSSRVSTRVNGQKEWQESSALDGLTVGVDKADRKYEEGATTKICGILEGKLGTGLNIARSAYIAAFGKELRVEYRCKGYHSRLADDNSKDKRCPFIVKVTTKVEDGTTSAKYKGCHTCRESHDYSTKQNGMTRSQKEYIKKALSKDKPPTEIYNDIVALSHEERVAKGLVGNGKDFPSVKQIQVYQKNCPDRLQAKTVRVDDLKVLLEQHSKTPSDADEPFAIGYRVNGPDDFDYAISTPRLLQKFEESDRRNLDATYKHSTSSYPITVAGVDDANRKHHRGLVGVSSNENWKNFEFLGKSQISHETRPVKRRRITLLADAAGAIRNGVRAAEAGRKRKQAKESNDEQVFSSRTSTADESPASPEDDSITMDMLTCLTTEGELLHAAATRMAMDNTEVYVTACYFHMKQAFIKNADKIKDRDQHEAEIHDDLNDLHNVPYPYEAAFDAALELFFGKWISKGEAEFVSYFRKHWGGETRRWGRAHHPPGYAAANNGLESHNGWMHMSGKYKRRQTVALFNFLLQEMRVASERARQEGGIARPKDRPKIPEKYWATYRTFKRRRENSHGMLEVPSADGKRVYYPSSVFVDKWATVATKELQKDEAYSRADDVTRTKMETELVTRFRDEALQKYIDFEHGLRSGDFLQLSNPVTSFDRFKKRLHSFHVVTKLPDDEKREDMCHGCTCPQCQEKAYCKHGLHEGRKAKLIVDPKDLRMDKKNRRGRPWKAKGRTLMREPGTYMSDSSESESGGEEDVHTGNE
mmetsp:Transcript_39476/g.86629  ORF Transcript_39476/g.86629 Transcript_39476/m.86629 type:complete len:921 (-) Transcript_39476:58-2820(-)